MSIFLGDQLTEVVEKIIDGKASVHATRGVLDLGADTLPKLMQDNTDRNRTSPFAFTGNKFEFRACGSEQNVSDSNLVLDAAVAKSLKSFADALEGTPEDEFQDAALEYCKKVLTDHQRILFSGDGYSDEWPVEAEKRGLANNKTTADALPAFVSDKAIALFEETGVLTKAEAQCRYDCKLEKYNKLMNIEATTMVREARRTYRPVITAYATKVAKALRLFVPLVRRPPCSASRTRSTSSATVSPPSTTPSSARRRASEGRSPRWSGAGQRVCTRGRSRYGYAARRRGCHGGDRGRRLLAGPDLR